METKYKLSCSLEGHEQDVRAVCATIFPNNGLISASRDSTARVWSRVEGSDRDYIESLVLGGHVGFVSSVAILPPDESNTHGIILTGSNDNTINAYTLDSPSPIYTLKGHEGNVCALVTGKFGTVLSGSWDKTARVWLKQKCVFTLKGHEAAIWAVALLPEAGYMLTGSADKTIRLWKTGKCELVFTGHEDCVRGLAVLSGAEFLSCSNDGTIRRWLRSGECCAVFAGHDNYVYSIALMANGEDFASCGEDRTLRVWRHGQCVQTIPHPTQSVWTVCVLDNDDIVTGSSDGVVRVFTRNEARMAPEDELEIYEAMVQSSTVPAQIGDLRTDQLPGPDFLLNPGTRDGQTVMVRRGDKIEAHQWSAGDECWHKLGDVLGGAGGGDQSKPAGGKTTYAGKEYDYVFDIRLNEGSPMKLPFNVTDDPWMAAHNFLEQNDLSQMYLDQVANYIIDQTKGVTLQSQAPAYSDPFTGGSRYVPSSSVGGTAPAAATNQNAFCDPLTGGSRYVPGSSSAVSAPTAMSANTFYPEKNYISFDSANITAMQGKVREFNADVDEGVRLSDDFLNHLPDITSGKAFTAQHLHAFHTALKWPAGKLFPLLDALRLSVRHRQGNVVASEGGENSLLAAIVRLMHPDGLPTNRMVAARVCCNAFAHEAGERLLVSMGTDVVERVVRCREATNDKNWQVVAATLLLNYAVALRRSRDVFVNAEAFTSDLLRAVGGLLLVWTWDVEATFRLLVAVGTVVTTTASARALAGGLDLSTAVRRCIDTHNPTKATECALTLLKDI